MKGFNKYEQAYRLETEKGVKAFLHDYHKIKEARFFANDLTISDLLMDFDLALVRALTERQRQVIYFSYYVDMKQCDVAKRLGLTQQTVQEHRKKAIKNLATYHMLLKRKAGE